MRSPRMIKEVQRLTGKVAALNRFISRATDKCLPFFKVLQQAFEWTTKSEEAFQHLKQCMANPPLLSQALSGEILFLYLAVSKTAVSAALIREDSSVQRPVYYISRALKGVEQNYPLLEKMALALVIASRRLRPYFQAHSIVVLTDQPLKKVMQQPELSGRLMQWCIELSQFEISYRSQTAIKGQAVADFIIEFTNPTPTMPPPPTQFNTETEDPHSWTLNVDGSSRKEGGDFDTKEDTMRAYRDIALPPVRLFNTFHIKHIPQSENSKADKMAQLASADQSDLSHGVRIESLTHLATSPNQQEVHFLQNEPIPWAADIFLFLTNRELPNNKQQATKVRAQSSNYILISGLLYKRRFSSLYLRCPSPTQATYVMRKVHEGVCGIIRVQDLWPTKSFAPVTSGLLSTKMPPILYLSVISASALPTSPMPHQQN
ncbi:uncharacterized protein LOC114321845 [Camellia sinensis]|uniref:uncharacterized protein LOC114321845 n=1 Tax=Camellia sinensis TaxID=4442 RepID=UPI001035F954|nr:uncharacterized protein LOC114321845 [Camellia sinensis]